MEATEDFDIRNKKASCLKAIPVDKYLKKISVINFFLGDEAKKNGETSEINLARN